MARAEVPAGFHRTCRGARLQINFGVGREEVGVERTISVFGRGDLQMRENFRRNQLVDENAAVLRVILKLDDVEVAVVGFQQMRLGAAPHLSDEPARIYRHGAVEDTNRRRASIDARRNEVRRRDQRGAEKTRQEPG